MSVVGDRTQYLNLEQIEAVCTQVAARLLVGGEALVGALRRELTAISANGLRSSALGQGQFGPHTALPGLIALAGPGGVGKTFFAELVAWVAYGERFAEHVLHVNCRAYLAGRFPPIPQAKLDSGPLTVISLEGVEVLPQLPPVAALWTDAIRYGRAAIPAANEQGNVIQPEIRFGRCLIVATANVGRELVTHIGFRPREAPRGAAETVGRPQGTGPADGGETGRDEASRLIEEALGTLFGADLAEVFAADRWIILPPLDPAGMRRLVDLQLTTLHDLLPRRSPPIQISEEAAARLIQMAQESRSPNKTAALVDHLHALVEPPINAALLRAAAPLPLGVQITLDGGAIRAQVEPVGSGAAPATT
jgi:ATP-dependent Clp protease ATP-binding subunit ClpA